MGVGLSIFLIAIGLVLALAVDADTIDFIQLDVVGWILVLCGALGLLVTIIIFAPRRRPGMTREDRRL